MGYKELDVWQKGREVVASIYQLSSSFPASEQFGLTSQLRRAAVSIPANIAEGYGRQSPKAYGQFLRVAKGSVNELETLLILATDLGFATGIEELTSKVAKLGSMLTNLIAKVEQNVVREQITQYEPTPIDPN